MRAVPKTRKMENKMPKVSFVITAYNNKEIIGECLKSVVKQNYKNFDLCVVDDCSSDGTAEFIEKNFKKIKVIRKAQQSGPSISRDIGIENTRSAYLVFMDSDVVLEKSWVKKLVGFLEKNNGVAMVGGKLLFKGTTKINSAGGGINRLGIGFDIGRGEDASRHNLQKDVMYVCSAAMVVRREMLHKIGGFDESYFYGHEDADLGWRANLAGYRVVYLPEAEAEHGVSMTVKTMSERVCFHSVKNRVASMIKNYQTHHLAVFLPIYILLELLSAVFRNPRLARLNALEWCGKHSKEIFSKRAVVQKLRKKQDRQLPFS